MILIPTDYDDCGVCDNCWWTLDDHDWDDEPVCPAEFSPEELRQQEECERAGVLWSGRWT